MKLRETPWKSSTYKDALLKKRTEILGTGGIKPLQASMENNTRQGDMADQASGNNEVHIQLKLKQTDAKILQAIEEALWRIEKGTYGVCRDCGEPIAPARLQRDSVDARLHHLQGKAELVTDVARRCSRSSTARNWRCCCGTRRRPGSSSQYDVNNTYQYIINREEVQLSWLAKAIEELGGAVPATRPQPAATPAGQGRRRRARGDRRGRPRGAGVRRPLAAAHRARWPTPATRRCSRVILGEVLEQKRFFEQALAGRTDLLGQRGEHARTVARRGAAVAVDRVTAAVALGSNLGDRRAHLDYAVATLHGLLASLTNLPLLRHGAGRRLRPAADVSQRRGGGGDDAVGAGAARGPARDRGRAGARPAVSRTRRDAGPRSDSVRGSHAATSRD